LPSRDPWLPSRDPSLLSRDQRERTKGIAATDKMTVCKKWFPSFAFTLLMAS
jgi:hypothetical protein